MATFNKVYIGGELALEVRLGEDIIDYAVTVLNSDGTPYSFTGQTGLNMFIYERRNRPIIATIAEGAGGVAISTNVVTINAIYADDIFIKDTGRYFYEMQHLDSAGRIIDTFFGPLKVI